MSTKAKTRKSNESTVTNSQLVRFDLMDGTKLFYWFVSRTMEPLQGWLSARMDELNYSDEFLSFFAYPNQMVYLRVSSIKCILFIDEGMDNVGTPTYCDSFDLVQKGDDGEEIGPDAVVKLKGLIEPLTYWDLDANQDFLPLEPELLENEHFLKSGFIRVSDEDGDSNYIPVCNIDCLEVRRDLVIPDEAWFEQDNVLVQSESLSDHKSDGHFRNL
jgi:hypothetical protein